jgi:hypothetical protein
VRALNLRVLAVGLALALALLALTTPVYLWFGGAIEPYIFGLPFFFGWTVSVVTLAFVAMVVFHLTHGTDEE